MRFGRTLMASAAAAGVGLFAWASLAQAPTTWDDVATVVSDNCTRCHGTNGTAGLNLSTYATAIAGSNRGAVLVAGDPDNSLLVRRIRGEITPQMPRGAAPLSADEIALIIAWIEGGLQE